MTKVLKDTTLNTLLLLSLIVACIITYYPILNNDFLYLWDDQWVVMNHYTGNGINWHNIWEILTSYYHGQYAPLNEYLYLVLYSINGYDSTIFHLASLLLHIVNTCLIYYILKKLLELHENTHSPSLIAWLAALIFAIHPFNVESVAWMSASKVLVYTLFYLLATIAYLKYLQYKKIRYYIITLVLFICSFLGKEQAVTFPLWLLLLHWFKNDNLTNKKIWIRLIPFFLLSIFFGVITMLSQSADGQGVLTDESTYPFWQRIVYACYAFTEYLFKCIIPYKLSYLYPFPAVIGTPLPKWLLIYPLLITIIIYLLQQNLKEKAILFSIFFFSLHIILVLHIIPLSRYTIIADRYVYLASIGIAFLIAYSIIYLYKALKISGRKLIIFLAIGYVFTLNIYTHSRCKVWHNSDTLKYQLKELLQHRNDYTSNIYNK
ncbi:glycosyltransferase family 39 protein [Parabacteroides pacaensis]|uniref:glycosyltransferase family 39 protein n=1 Tax=Parabacteroides pacaensis TaxID=2086575 RepID=UPI000D0E89F9|nr:glycosyltransferase family 39 protein [Parabacteroides pacaensis]